MQYALLSMLFDTLQMKISKSLNILFRSPATFALHIALSVVVAGALITYFTGIQGKITLSEGGEPVCRYEVTGNIGDGKLPFCVQLLATEVSYYPDTSSPSDFASELRINLPDGSVADGRVSMNRVFQYRGWRFYQTAVAPGSSTLTIARDPAGIAVTYTGYILLGVSMIFFLLSRSTGWRAAVRRLPVVVVVLMSAVRGGATPASERTLPSTIQRPLAREMGKLLIYDQGRIRPMSAFAADFTRALCGSDNYRGLTPEQVLAGWLFYYDSWKREPMIRIKGRKLCEALGVDGNYASLRDFFSPDGYRLETLIADRTDRNVLDADARVALISTVATGAAFRMFPYESASGVREWLSWGSVRPSAIDAAQWQFISGTLPDINRLLAQGRNVAVDSVFGCIAGFQREVLAAGGTDCDQLMKKASVERLYSRYVKLFPCGGLFVMAGLILVFLSVCQLPRRYARSLCRFSFLVAAVGLIYVSALLAARWYIGGHIPLSNGYETMLTMGFIALVGSVVAAGRWQIVRGGLLVAAGLATLVAAMSGGGVQIGPLMPVLASPWLSVHVLLVMTAYSLAALITVVSVTALCAGDTRRRNLADLSLVLLLPAVFLLAAGIFTGAVWANQAWGRYWGWDPKETCALVTMLIYALPLHRRSVGFFRNPKAVSSYLALAFLAVLFTYFGANYLLPGLHSYA